ncbi:MAG: ATP synthase F1 subunit gamma [Oscillospiraceae bacterium]
MAGSMKDIKRRIKSVQSTGQITKAMELVASSKLKKAKEAAQNARPYFDTLYDTIVDIASINRDYTSEYTKKREIKNSLFVVIAGDRGLAGGYNANVFKLTQQLMKDKNVKVLTIGNKSSDYYKKNDFEVVASFNDIAQTFDAFAVNEIAEIIDNLYKSGEIDEAFVIYTQFISAINQTAVALPLLPLSIVAKKDSENKVQYTEYDPSPETVFNLIIPSYLSGIVYGTVVESYAAEQAARRMAMESASDNAAEMIDNLSLSYNRARQAAITQEISEIVAGANY